MNPTQFKKGDKVFIKDCPTLKGEVLGFISTEEEQIEYLNVRYWIPEDEPFFIITGIYEEMWSLPDEVEYIDPMQAETKKALRYSTFPMFINDFAAELAEVESRPAGE